MYFPPSNTEEHVEKLAFEPTWGAGYPEPHLIQSEHKAFLLYFVSEHDPKYGSDKPTIALVEWRRCRGAHLGHPNDEVLHGHRLWDKGLEHCLYEAGIVKNSSWIQEMKRVNSVHRSHSEALFTNATHFIFSFHDSTFECVADSYNVEVFRSETAAQGTFESFLKYILHTAVDRLMMFP